MAVIILFDLGWDHDAMPASPVCGIAQSTSPNTFLVFPPLVAMQMKPSTEISPIEKRSNAILTLTLAGKKMPNTWAITLSW